MAHVRSMRDPALEKAAKAVVAKIAATLPDDREQQLLHAVSRVYRANEQYVDPNLVDTIRKACRAEEAVAIEYVDQHEHHSERTIWPLAITYSDNTLTILSWCCLREGFRMFVWTGLHAQNPRQ